MKPARILFLCTGNSARSQMAEAIARHLGHGAIEAVSAGTSPRDEVHPAALRTLRDMGLDVSGLRPKPIDEVRGANYDYVVTVCDRARESCPVLPGAQMNHWSFKDPAEAPPDRIDEAFNDTALALFLRIRTLIEFHDKYAGKLGPEPLGTQLLAYVAKGEAEGRS
jgi:protein-tyrosine-phosphatase